jgi:NitT/TauT family transport system ATP-binding protein
MGDRPGTIIRDLDVPLPRPRSIETMNSKVMHDFTGQLRSLLLKRAA